MKLESVHIETFKGIKACQFQFTDATMLVGTNNSGKSSILQAIHLAARAMAQAPEANKQSTLSIATAEYVPSETYREIGYHASWGNQQGSPESRISFTFIDPSDNKQLAASVILKSARNEGISVNPTIDQKLLPVFRGKDSTFSAYIPGIAGIPLSEVVISTRHMYRKAASGDSNVVLRNILLKIKNDKKMDQLLDYVRDIYPGVAIDVSFDDSVDYVINVSVTFGGSKSTKPLEFSGAGFIHVLQIFSYLVLFRPRIILIDEPESHLHPTLQTKLTNHLQKRARENGAVALITTHSPFVARGLSPGSRTVWIDKGAIVATASDNSIRKALGWGALDRTVLLCTEDSETHLLGRLMSQSETLNDRVAVFPFDGVSKLGSGAALNEFVKALGSQHKVVIHRDRDCMLDKELSSWSAEYQKFGFTAWATDGSDIEMYFCGPEYIAAALSISKEDGEALLDSVVHEHEESFKKVFFNKRSEINKRIYEKIGGSPDTEELWKTLPITQRIKGKDLLSRLREAAQAKGLNEKALGRTTEKYVAAPSFIKILEGLCKK